MILNKLSESNKPFHQQAVITQQLAVTVILQMLETLTEMVEFCPNNN